MENENSTVMPQGPVGKPGRKMGVARLVGTVCAVLLVVCLFLPLFTGTEWYLDYLDGYPDDYVDESLGLKVHETASVSPVDYGRIYGRIFDGVDGAIYIGVTAFLAGAALLTLLFAALNKPIGALLFDILAFAAFRLMVYDLDERGVVPSRNWDWGVDYYLLHIVTAAIAVAAVWMLVVKIKAKRAAKAARIDPQQTA